MRFLSLTLGLNLFAVAVLVGAGPPAASSLESLPLLKVLELRGITYHVQGIDTDGKRLWTTSVDSPHRKGYLHEFSMTNGNLLRSVELQDGERFHPGGIASDRDSLWVPVAEYRASSSSVIQRRNKRSFEVEFQFSVPDHIGCIVATSQLLIGGNWDSREFYVWNHEGNLIRKIANTTGNSYQDMKSDGKYIVASGALADHKGAIDWLDRESLRLAHRLVAGKTDRGASYTREGMTIHGGRLMLLPEDGPSRLFVFRVR